MYLERLFDSSIHVIVHRIFTEEDLDGKSPSRYSESRYVPEEHRELARIHRSRCNNQLEIVTTSYDLKYIYILILIVKRY